MNVALQSILVGIGLSVGLMIIAAFGVLPALIGAWLQEGVDVISILWALRAGTGSKEVRDPSTTSPAEKSPVAAS